MGYVVLHIQKGTGNDAGTSAHIERTITPSNVNPELSYLNKQLITYPEGIKNRTEAIQHRLNNAGITRKISKNQVTVLQIMLSGTHENMKEIEESGKLDEWCEDNLKYIKDTFGEANLVAAHLHRDETTPHIHATVIPIVTGERRKAKKETSTGKRKYKKKTNRPRLCADDVMARDKLVEYQDTYAKYMEKYGLQRGIEGSKAKHILTTTYYRNLVHEGEKKQQEINRLLSAKEEITEQLEQLQNKQKLQKVTGKVLDSIGTIFGNNKLEESETQNKELRDRIQILEEKLDKQNQTITTNQASYEKEISSYKAQIEHIYNICPIAKELLTIENLCKEIGLSNHGINMLLDKKPILIVDGKLYSEQYQMCFIAKNSVLELTENPKGKNMLELLIDKINILDWFNQKYQEFKKQNSIRKQVSKEIKKQNPTKGFRI